MENASKALIIAGGVFLVIAILTFGVYVYSGIHHAMNSEDEKNAQEQLATFNKKYAAYNKPIMYGVDVISVYNMAQSDFEKNGFNIEISIISYVDDNLYVTYDGGRIANGKLPTDLNAIKGNTEMLSDFKRRVFECTSIHYDEETGRIDEMKFSEKNV